MLNKEALSVNLLSAIETTTDLVFITDPEGIILYVNPAFEKITGFTCDEVLGHSPGFLKSGLEEEETYTRMWNTILSGKAYRTIIINRKKNGELFYEEKTITPVFSKSGEIENFVSSGKDITERINFEKEQERLLERLENSNKELDEFTRIISHDLKTPVANISALSGYLINHYSKNHSPEEKKFMTLIHEQANLMISMISGLLQYARAGNMKAEKELFDLNLMVNEIAEQHKLTAHVEIIVEEKLPVVHYNRIHMNQVFSNLVGNAVKYMDKPKGVVRIGSRRGKNCIEYFVEDNGPGIDEKHFHKIFDVFETIGENNKNTGIGLSIVKKIIECNGGKIWVESKPGNGSVFRFTVPHSEEDEAAQC